MPTNETNSLENFNKHLNILHKMIMSYNQLGTDIVCGDLNRMLVMERTNCHNNSLKDFVKEHNLSWHKEIMGNKSTFVSHSGRCRTQIDYVLC